MYLLATGLAIGLLVGFPNSTTKSISYCDFIQMVRTSQIAEVVIVDRASLIVRSSGGVIDVLL
jgi:hypothetical protein